MTAYIDISATPLKGENPPSLEASHRRTYAPTLDANGGALRLRLASVA